MMKHHSISLVGSKDGPSRICRRLIAESIAHPDDTVSFTREGTLVFDAKPVSFWAGRMYVEGPTSRTITVERFTPVTIRGLKAA